MRMLTEFRQFALRGNVVDMAVAFTVGVAFTTIVQSLVADVLMPPIGLLVGEVDFVDRFLVLREGATAPPPYATLSDAQAAGAVTVNYGLFLSKLAGFVLVALCMFLLVRVINRVHSRLEAEFAAEKPEPGEPTDKKCSYCLSTVPFKATRCPACTSELGA